MFCQKTTISLGLVLLLNITAVQAMILPQPPEGAMILVDGETYTLSGRLTRSEANVLVLGNLSGSIWERHRVMRPGIEGAPTQDVPVSSVLLSPESVHDMQAVLELVGAEARLDLSGRWSVTNGVGMLEVSTIHMGDHDLPIALPPMGHALNLARLAAREHLEGQPGTRVVGEISAMSIGGLMIRLDAEIAVGRCGTAHPVSLIYNVLTGEVSPAC